MKEQEFLNKLGMNWDTLFIKIGVFYAVDDDGNVLFDEDSMRDIFENELKEIKDILKLN